MIHILTVHWRQDHFVDIQQKYLKKNINEPYQVYAFLNYLPQDHSDKFFYSSTEPIPDHASKLDLLSEVAISQAISKNDILIFIDGDAFPIKPIMPFIYEKLKTYPLIAVQRFENLGDIQPHPLFTVTTIGFWEEIQGNWQRGYSWKNSEGKMVSDVGGNLLKILKEKKINWYSLLRSNKINYHPINIAVYEDLIYHHGAGFRGSFTRVDYIGRSLFSKGLDRLLQMIPNKKFSDRLVSLIPRKIKIKKNIIRNNNELSEKFFKKLQQDPNFYHELID